MFVEGFLPRFEPCGYDPRAFLTTQATVGLTPGPTGHPTPEPVPVPCLLADPSISCLLFPFSIGLICWLSC